MTIRILSPGMLTTVQDLGRFGCAHLGISPSGAADSLSFRIANLLVGNDENAPALEMTLTAPKVKFDTPATFAIAGSAIGNAQQLPLYRAIHAEPGFVIEDGSLVNGARSYLAVAGGFQIPRVMQSAATHLAGGFGGFCGRRLQAGDVLAFDLPVRNSRGMPAALGQLLQRSGPIRITKGPQWDWFDGHAQQRFLSSPFTVLEQSNRAGLRLAGFEIRPEKRSELLTEGVALGAIQITGDAQPIILFVDQQTTGGYPKIANVASIDLPRIGQLRPRDSLQFELVELSQAVALIREQERIFNEAVQ